MHTCLFLILPCLTFIFPTLIFTNKVSILRKERKKREGGRGGRQKGKKDKRKKEKRKGEGRREEENVFGKCLLLKQNRSGLNYCTLVKLLWDFFLLKAGEEYSIWLEAKST